MVDGKPERIVCLRCRASDDFGVFKRSLVKQAQAHAEKELQETFEGVSLLDEGGMFGVSAGYTPAKIDQATGKFVVDFD